jgi:ankyrin repeat protein
MIIQELLLTGLVALGCAPQGSVERARHSHLIEAGDCKSIQTAVDLKKFDVNYAVRSTGFTPIHIAARDGNVKLAQAMLDRNAKLGSLSYKLSSPEVKGISFLPDSEMTPLMVASALGHTTMVDFLLNSGKSTENQKARSALVLAALHNQYDTMRRLFKVKDILLTVDATGNTALLSLLDSKQTGAHAHNSNLQESVRLLIHNGAEVNAQNRWKNTPLILAAADGNEALVEQLVQLKANVAMRNQSGQSAYDVAGEQSLKAFLHQALAKEHDLLMQHVSNEGARVEALVDAATSK